MKDFMELAKARYSVRQFSEREVEKEKIEQIIEAGLAAPTAANRQPYHIWLVTGDEARAKLARVNRMPFVQAAKVNFIIGADPKPAWVRPSDGRNFADVDASIVATQMILAIHDLGLGSTWVGFFDEPAMKAEFPEMADYDLIAILPVGYPAEDAEPRESHFVRRDRAEAVTEL